jgi:ribosomal protein S18 acetylase RimI-like enzyme
MCRSTYMTDLYVDMTARRCGIGRALMAVVAHVTQLQGGRTLHWTVLRDNEGARAFYRKLGKEMSGIIVCRTSEDRLAGLAAAPVPPGLALRRATAEDVPVVAGLLDGLLRHEGFDTAQLDLVNRLAVDGFGTAPAFACTLAERAGRIVGYSLYWPAYDTEPGDRGIYLSDIYVAPEAKRGGIGRALMGAVARHTLALGATYLEWEVRADNSPARAFYATFSREHPEVVSMTASGARFAALAALGATLPVDGTLNR